MSDKLIEIWQRAKIATETAEEWNNLPDGTKYENSTFQISTAHCKAPQLTRTGQQYHSGKNYWETKAEFNLTILEYIIDNWKEIYPKVLDRMKLKEREALKACKSYIDEMQRLIDEAE